MFYKMNKNNNDKHSFCDTVYKTILKIPKGKVTTYGAIAKKLKTSPRAVGQALKKNPNAPITPCHRVIKSDGTLGGYNGKNNSRKKIQILKSEGINIYFEKNNYIIREDQILKKL